VLRVLADGDRSARRRDDDPLHAGSLARREDRPGPVDVDAVKLLGVLGTTRDLARAVERSVGARTSALDGASVENVAARDDDAAVLQLGTRWPPRKPVAPVTKYRAIAQPSSKTFWNVRSSSMSFDFTAPERNSAGPGM
jgi:hypothetical protein